MRKGLSCGQDSPFLFIFFLKITRLQLLLHVISPKTDSKHLFSAKELTQPKNRKGDDNDRGRYKKTSTPANATRFFLESV